MIKQRYDFDEVRKIYQENQKQLDNLVQNIVQLSCENGQTIATAESCTGGLLSQKITAVPGASQMFALGICTYTNEMKTAILHVPESTLHTYTAVSPQTAIAMANGVAALSYADLALSVTGYAGPGGGTSEHPVGTVFLGVAYHGTAFAVHLPFDRMGVSTREGVRQGTAVCAFGIAREILMEESVCRNIYDRNSLFSGVVIVDDIVAGGESRDQLDTRTLVDGLTGDRGLICDDNLGITDTFSDQR